MTTEHDVMEALKETVVSNLNTYLEIEGIPPVPTIEAHNVTIDFPDPDNMRKDTMFFIQPDYGNYEGLSLMSDQASLSIQIFIIAKGASSEELIKRVFAYYAALYSLLRSYQDLGGVVEETAVTDMDYYPALSATKTQVGIEARVLVSWCRGFERR